MRNTSILLAFLPVIGCDGGGEGPATEPRRELPPVVAHQPLTPLSGGTLAVAADGSVAVAGDPEGHQIFVVDLRDDAVRGRLAVPGGEPGRVVLGDGEAFVALRTGGVVRLSLDTAAELGRLPACDTPRGLALEGARLHVACAEGALVTLDTTTGEEVRRLVLEPDLRDVVVGADRLFVTTFRSAEVLVIQGDSVVGRWAARTTRPEEGARVPAQPAVAWRTVGLPGGRLMMLHQRARLSRVVTEQPGGYGTGDGDCARSIVTPAVTVFEPDGRVLHDGRLPDAVLAVDVAVRADGTLAVAAPGARGRPSVAGYPAIEQPDGCYGPQVFREADDLEVVAVAMDAAGQAYALSRQPLALVRLQADGTPTGALLSLGEAQEDTGHALFHHDAGGGIACASCHPEGGDDGQTWLFEGFGLRRTQHLRGGLKGREPFHWEGDLRDMGALVEEVMVKRMGGTPLTADHTERLLTWIDAQPAIRLKSLENREAVARGATLFADPAVGCVGCHTDGVGDGRTYDVGTGGFFQVPSLRGLALRGPYLHDGCAATLHDRFGPCGGGDAHGTTSHLGAAEIGDLVAFLETL